MEVDEAMPARPEKQKVRFVVVCLENVIFAKQQGRGMGWDVFLFCETFMVQDNLISSQYRYFRFCESIDCKGLTSYRTRI